MRSFRFTISGLMGIVVVVSLALAALRSSSSTWAGVTLLLATGVMSLGVVGAVCGRESERAWWSGSASSAGAIWRGVLSLVFPELGYRLPRPPTTALFFPLRSYIVSPPSPMRGL